MILLLFSYTVNNGDRTIDKFSLNTFTVSNSKYSDEEYNEVLNSIAGTDVIMLTGRREDKELNWYCLGTCCNLKGNEIVFKNLGFAFIGKKMDIATKMKLCEEVLESIGLKHHLEEKLITLSGGEKQRLAIARVILKNPNIIIADEPTGNLDPKNTNIVYEYLINLNSSGKTVILITHKEFNYESDL